MVLREGEARLHDIHTYKHVFFSPSLFFLSPSLPLSPCADATLGRISARVGHVHVRGPQGEEMEHGQETETERNRKRQKEKMLLINDSRDC